MVMSAMAARAAWVPSLATVNLTTEVPPSAIVGGSASSVAVRSAMGRNAGSSLPPPPETSVTAGSLTGGASSVAGTPTRYRFFRSRES